ncbi:hypothetical protein [Psychrobacter immobilis]|uniref:hypothetical protein n=1 Tax=Psychrobacter immobilis TaxID=498 RepID=UPI001917F9A1|nr:hypothetical protein [Psychrobacter immobilis]
MKNKLKKFFRDPTNSFIDTYKRRSFSFIDFSELNFEVNLNPIDKQIVRLFPKLERNDKDLLNDVSRSIISLNSKQFQIGLEVLISQLSDRTDIFGDSFTITRFDGWCSTLCNLSGMYCYANQYFLEEKGVIFPDEYYDELHSLLKLGVNHLINKQGEVKNIIEWMKIDEDSYKNSRKYLANALNYLAREAYSYSRERFKGDYGIFLRRYDVLAHSYVFANINMVDIGDTHLANLYDIHAHMKDFLLNKNNQKINTNLFIEDQSSFFKKIFYMFVNLSIRIFKTEDVVEFKKWFYIPKKDANFKINIQPLLPVILNHIEEFPYFSDRFSKLMENESIAIRMEKLKFNVQSGRMGIINIEHLFIEKIENALLGDIYHILNVLTYLSFEDKLKITELLEQRLKVIRISSGHNVNFLARIIQIKNLQVDIKNQKLLNRAYHISVNSNKGSNLEENDKVVLFALNQCRIVAPMMAGISRILFDNNYKFYNLEEHYDISKNMTRWPYSPRLSSDFMSCNGVISKPKELLNTDWLVDLNNSCLMLDGINYYQGMYERVSRVLKVFNVPWELPAAQLYFKMWLIQIDRVIYALKEVRKVAIKKNIKVILVSAQSHFVPYFALKTFAINHSKEFSHVTINSSYENWKTNVGGNPLSTLTFMNNSKQEHPSLPAFGSYTGFNKWYSKIYSPFKELWSNERAALTSMKRSGSAVRSVEIDEMFIQLKLAKKSGKKIFCAIGKIPYDLAVPYQGGPAHKDMGDWLNHTVKTIENSNNLLLVKPHPHELKTEISGKPIEGFLDMIKNKDSLRNTVLLPHLGVNLQDLFEYVDIFICWNGSSIAELGAQGRNVIACDDWAKHNYPIDVYLPKNRPHYCNILEGKVEVKMSSKFFEKSEAYTIYLTQAPFALKYKFATRSSTNIRFNEAKINLVAFNERSFNKLATKSELILNTFS